MSSPLPTLNFQERLLSKIDSHSHTEQMRPLKTKLSSIGQTVVTSKEEVKFNKFNLGSKSLGQTYRKSKPSIGGSLRQRERSASYDRQMVISVSHRHDQ